MKFLERFDTISTLSILNMLCFMYSIVVDSLNGLQATIMLFAFLGIAALFERIID